MLRMFEVENYRRFSKKLTFSFCNTSGYKFNEDCLIDGLLGKAIIYGRNATGKTCLGKAIDDISYIVRPVISLRDSDPSRLNADSGKSESCFRYEFCFGSDLVSYSYARNGLDDLVTEQLDVNGRVLFAFDFRRQRFSQLDLFLEGTETLQSNLFLDSVYEGPDRNPNELSFLRYVLRNAALPKESVLRKLEFFVLGMRMTSVLRHTPTHIALRSTFSRQLEEKSGLENFETFLNQMGIKCRLSLIEQPDGGKLLCFVGKVPVPFFANASSGTLAITDFYRAYIARPRRPTFMYLDEFDAFYHYEMSEMLLLYLKKNFPDTQIVFTTHNTNLMINELMRPDALLILSGDGRLTSLCDATERELREGHNLEKLYIAGEFDAYE